MERPLASLPGRLPELSPVRSKAEIQLSFSWVYARCHEAGNEYIPAFLELVNVLRSLEDLEVTEVPDRGVGTCSPAKVELFTSRLIPRLPLRN